MFKAESYLHNTKTIITLIMFSQLFLIGILVAVTSAAPSSPYEALELADNCNESLCRLPNCRCSSTQIPGGLTAAETPQVILHKDSFLSPWLLEN